MVKHIGEGISGAIFSEDRQYRYALWRVWDREKPALTFIGLNPSTANTIKDDPTVCKVAAIARYRHYGGIYIGNLFALVSSNPDVLFSHSRKVSPVGPKNDNYLKELKRVPGIILVGWGDNACGSDRYREVLGILGVPVYCLAVTKKGQPYHPLYVGHWAELNEYLPAPSFSG